MTDAPVLKMHSEAPESGALKALLKAAPSCALFLSLAIAFGSMLSLGFRPLPLIAGLLAAAAFSLLPKGRAGSLRVVTFSAVLFSFAVSEPLREGLMLLANRVFQASEAVNSYAYDYFAPVLSEGSPVFAICLLLIALVLAAAASLWKSRPLIGLMFIAAAAFEAYFGVTPGLWANLLLAAVIAALAVSSGGDMKGGAAVLAGASLIALAVFIIAPSPNRAVEDYSEQLRDRFAVIASGFSEQFEEPETVTEDIKQESRQHEELTDPGKTAENDIREFEKQTENEKELSLPERIDYLRIILLTLLVLLLLTVPFLPFLIFTRARRLTEERLASFAVPSDSEAICALFSHTLDWLKRAGLDTKNQPYSLCEGAVREMTSEDYAEAFSDMVPIWQEARYSDHPMSGEQREAARALLDTTAGLLYDRADRLTRFKMRYIDCLCGSTSLEKA
ncbi:MAG: hypothetical protein IJM17_05730 [Firmicutes bacterium]|nr:hypothetical protein [Bacillota bacterium]